MISRSKSARIDANDCPCTGPEGGSESTRPPGFMLETTGESESSPRYFAIQSTASCPALRKSSTYRCQNSAWAVEVVEFLESADGCIKPFFLRVSASHVTVSWLNAECQLLIAAICYLPILQEAVSKLVRNVPMFSSL